jgi:hypothetical protein
MSTSTSAAFGAPLAASALRLPEAPAGTTWSAISTLAFALPVPRIAWRV